MPKSKYNTVLDSFDFNKLKTSMVTKQASNLEDFKKLICSGPAGLHKFKVEELKKIIKFLKEEKKIGGLNVTGKKQDLIDKLVPVLYIDYADSSSSSSSTSTPPPHSSPLPLPPRETMSPVYHSSSAIPGTSVFTIHKPEAKHYSPLNVERKRSPEEQHLMSVLSKDPTIKGHQDPYFEVLNFEDVVSLRKATHAGFMLLLTEEKLTKIQSQQLVNIQLHLFTHELKPQNWFPDIRITVNTFAVDLPRPNKRLSKKTGKHLLIASTPLVIPKNFLKLNNTIDIKIPPMAALDGVLIIEMVVERSLQEMMDAVKARGLDGKAPFQTDIVPPRPTEVISTSSSSFCELPVATGSLLPPISTLSNSQPSPWPLGSTSNFMPVAKKPIITANDDDDDVIIEDKEMITLRDPITMGRIENPAKSRSCLHKKCFDLESYLLTAQQSKVWNCPLCDQPATFQDLILDSLVLKILQTTDEQVEKVEVRADGSFEPVKPNTKADDSVVSSKPPPVPKHEVMPEEVYTRPTIPAMTHQAPLLPKVQSLKELIHTGLPPRQPSPVFPPSRPPPSSDDIIEID